MSSKGKVLLGNLIAQGNSMCGRAPTWDVKYCQNSQFTSRRSSFSIRSSFKAIVFTHEIAFPDSSAYQPNQELVRPLSYKAYQATNAIRMSKSPSLQSYARTLCLYSFLKQMRTQSHHALPSLSFPQFLLPWQTVVAMLEPSWRGLSWPKVGESTLPGCSKATRGLDRWLFFPW